MRIWGWIAVAVVSMTAARADEPPPLGPDRLPVLSLLALGACERTLSDLGTTGVPDMFLNCAWVYRSPCREAVRSTRDQAISAVDAMLGPCRAYCPVLPEPVPSACRGPVSHDTAAQAALELDTAILALTFSVPREVAAQISLFRTMQSREPIRAMVPWYVRSSWARDFVYVTEASSGTFTFRLGEKAWLLSPQPTSMELAPLLEALHPDLPLIIDCEVGVSSAHLKRVLDALRAAGVRTIKVERRGRQLIQ